MQLVVRRLLLFLSLSFLVIPRVPFLLLIFWMSRGCTERNIVFPPPRPSSSLSLPFSTTCGGGHRWWTAPQYSSFRSIPLSVLSLSTRNDRNASMHPASEAVHNRRRRRRLDCYVINYYIALLQRRRVALVVSGRLSSSFLFYLFICFVLSSLYLVEIGGEREEFRAFAGKFV